MEEIKCLPMRTGNRLSIQKVSPLLCFCFGISFLNKKLQLMKVFCLAVCSWLNHFNVSLNSALSSDFRRNFCSKGSRERNFDCLSFLTLLLITTTTFLFSIFSLLAVFSAVHSDPQQITKDFCQSVHVRYRCYASKGERLIS